MTLSETVLDPARRPHLVADLVGVVDAEVKDKKGLGGMAIKGAYAAVRKVSPTIAETATDRMLPDFAVALDPFWVDFGGAGDFGAYLAGRGDEVADALLAVTDRRAAATDRAPLQKAYGSVRGKAHENVKAALPRLGATFQRYAG
ncbi:DUF6918 family protein [Rudaeicoccus suwonensis]|uniref:DUF6918 family protein n=1 Tax=Rudaeicoccus suwonensis TaxID=657409 RepID=UPI0011A9B6DF|nr:hypothetical protein [Rudaeicoccus suwonensis]